MTCTDTVAWVFRLASSAALVGMMGQQQQQPSSLGTDIIDESSSAADSTSAAAAAAAAAPAAASLTKAEVAAGLPLERRRELLLQSMDCFQHWTGAPKVSDPTATAAVAGTVAITGSSSSSSS